MRRAVLNFRITFVALSTTALWYVSIIAITICPNNRILYIAAKWLGHVDSITNDVCLAMIAGSSTQIRRLCERLSEVSFSVENLLSLELGACNLLRVQVSGTFQVVQKG